MNIFSSIPYLTAGAVVIAILFAITQRVRQSATKTSQTSLPAMPVVHCFKCGKQLAEGFVMIGSMSWRPIQSAPRRFTGTGEKLKNISPDQSFALLRPGVPENRAFRCADCLVITIDHSQLYVFVKK